MKSENEKDVVAYCEVCGKPKECRYFNADIGITVTVPVQCDCESSKADKELTGWKEKQRMIRISNLRAEGVRDRERRGCRFELADKTTNIEKCMKYVENWDEMKAKNVGLLMWGACGNGKSFAAACIANALIDRNIPVLMTSLPMILGDQNNIMDVVRQMKEYELVIIDDLGAERQSQYALEKTFFVIDERYKSGKPLIITTNQILSEMMALRENGSSDHKRIYDRVFEMCTPFMFEDTTRRKKPEREKMRMLKQVFAQ